MAENPPVVYILHGDDEYSITQFVDSMVDKLGDPAFAGLNTTRLDGRTVSIDEIENTAATLPFLVKRRVVIVTNPLSRITTPAGRERLKTLLGRLTPATALLLVEHRPLVDERDRRKGVRHWLEKWAESAGEQAFVKEFPMPKGEAFVRRLQQQAQAAGGQLSKEAAVQLAALLGEDPLTAEQEIHKLLAYVDYARPVDIDDVNHLTIDAAHGDIFAMVDAMGSQKGQQAVDMLHRLLEEQDAIYIFGMIVRQFRLLLQAREVMDSGGRANQVAEALKLHPFVAEKVSAQARSFTLPVLEAIYHRLLELDLAMKTGEIESDVALDTLIASITN